MSAFYIMKARHMTSSGRKLGLKKILRDEPDCSIIVATRTHGWDKKVPCFIIGCRNDYSVKQGDMSSHTIDTGMGYTNTDRDLLIEDVLQVKNGMVYEINGVKVDPCVPKWNARYTFVMK